MKKEWTNPALESLEITATAGGPINNNTQDGPEWYNKENNQWERPYGEHPNVSEV